MRWWLGGSRTRLGIFKFRSWWASSLHWELGKTLVTLQVLTWHIKILKDQTNFSHVLISFSRLLKFWNPRFLKDTIDNVKSYYKAVVKSNLALRMMLEFELLDDDCIKYMEVRFVQLNLLMSNLFNIKNIVRLNYYPIE